IHFVFLLPLVLPETRIGRPPVDAAGETTPATPISASTAGVWAALLFMCAAQYGTVLVLPDLPIHFYLASVLLFAALTAVLFFPVRGRALAAGWFRPRPPTG